MSNDRESSEEGGMCRERCSDRMRETRGEQKCESVAKGNRDSVTSKKPVAADTEHGTDPVAPSSMGK